MQLNNFKSIYGLINDLYGISMDPNTFEDVALNGWQLIGNRRTKLHRYTTSTINKSIQIPCNADSIEGVFGKYPDSQNELPHSNFTNGQLIEQYTEVLSKHANLYNSGKLLKYRLEGEYITFPRDYDSVTILYHGIITDNEGLPLLTDKEVQALAAYCAYIDTYKRSLILKDGNLMQLAAVLKQDWLRACNSARIPNQLSQNDLNDVLDVKTRWDRKQYGKSFKPIL